MLGSAFLLSKNFTISSPPFSDAMYKGVRPYGKLGIATQQEVPGTIQHNYTPVVVEVHVHVSKIQYTIRINYFVMN